MVTLVTFVTFAVAFVFVESAISLNPELNPEVSNPVGSEGDAGAVEE
jgi:hypothetical protein